MQKNTIEDICLFGRVDVIMGTLLGDACIYKRLRSNKVKVDSEVYAFSFSQHSEEFCKWKADLIGFPYRIYRRSRFDNRTQKTYIAYDCHIRMPKVIASHYYNLFYRPRKMVSMEVLNNLTDLSVAIWYMDDGCMYYNGNNCHLTLSTDGFLLDDTILIIEWFKNNYGINFKYHRGAIRLTSNIECLKFMGIVEKYIPECMEYKILSKAKGKYNNQLSDERKKNRNIRYR